MKKSSIIVIALLVVASVAVTTAFSNKVSIKGFLLSVYSTALDRNQTQLVNAQTGGVPGGLATHTSGLGQQYYVPGKNEKPVYSFYYRWQEPNSNGTYFMYELNDRVIRERSDPNSLYNTDPAAWFDQLTVPQITSKPQRNPTTITFGTQTFGEWSKQTGLKLSANPYYNARILLEFASSQGATPILKSGDTVFGPQIYVIDDFGRPLCWGRLCAIIYYSDPYKPETWNPYIIDPSKVQGYKMQWDTQDRDWVMSFIPADRAPGTEPDRLVWGPGNKYNIVPGGYIDTTIYTDVKLGDPGVILYHDPGQKYTEADRQTFKLNLTGYPTAASVAAGGSNKPWGWAALFGDKGSISSGSAVGNGGAGAGGGGGVKVQTSPSQNPFSFGSLLRIFQRILRAQ